MPLKIATDPAPLFTDEDGVVRVGNTRVRLDSVVYAFNQGASPEEILQRYPSLALADIYATISYYLRHRTSADEYLKDRNRNMSECVSSTNRSSILQAFATAC